jgi:hypothetical protein
MDIPAAVNDNALFPPSEPDQGSVSENNYDQQASSRRAVQRRVHSQ